LISLLSNKLGALRNAQGYFSYYGAIATFEN